MFKRIFSFFSLVPLVYLATIYGLYIYIAIVRGEAPFYGDNIPIPESVNWLYLFSFYLFDYVFIISIIILLIYIFLLGKRNIKRNEFILNLGIISTIYFLIEAYVDVFSIQMWLFD